MNIETNIKDVTVSPLDSNGSKGSFGSDDSLEYSNDDRSVTNKIVGSNGVESDKHSDKYLPPKYPLSSITHFNHPDVNMVTPKRKQIDNTERLPGPLNLFSPGLSPIGHANHSQYGPDELADGDFSDVKRVEKLQEASFDANLKGSMDSLETNPLGYNDANREGSDDSRPNYQFWRNKLFSNDLATDSVLETQNNIEKQSLLFSVPQKSFIRSNSNSFDSDLNLTPRHSLIYPTTDALYERLTALSPRSADVSMDSELHVTKQSLIYPTTNALYERSTHLKPDSNIDNDTHVRKQSLVVSSNDASSAEIDSFRPISIGRGKPSADVSMDSDAQVTHQSLVYPTTNALFERSYPRSADVSLDSEMQVTKQSLVHPTSAVMFEMSHHAETQTHIGNESGSSLILQSFLRPPKLAVENSGNMSPNVSQLSMLERSSMQESYHEEDALGQSLHSISLLPSSPSSTVPKRLNQLVFPPPHPVRSFSPSNQDIPSGSRSAVLHAVLHSNASLRRPGHASSSDTEYARSTSKRRLSEQSYRQGGPVWKEAEDLAPSSTFSIEPRPFSDALSSKNVARTTNISSVPTETSHNASLEVDPDDELSVSPTAPPSPSSVSAGSPAAAAHHQHAAAPSSSSSLVVGALYTLQVDSLGRPAFVPVILDQRSNSGNPVGAVSFSSPNISNRRPATTHSGSVAGLRGDTHTTPRIQHQTSVRVGYPAQDTSLETGWLGANSNRVDVDEVLDRALHRGSLSEEKLKRWSGETTKMNSSLPTHNRGDHGLPPVTPLRHAHHPNTTVTPRTGHTTSSKSPFRLAMGADGKDHLQLSTEYYKERLLVRSLTSVLNTPLTR